MIPSRGLVRPGQALGLRFVGRSKPATLPVRQIMTPGTSRLFGSVPVSRNARSFTRSLLGASSGLVRSSSLTSATVLSATLLPRHIRFNSTQPMPTPSAESAAPVLDATSTTPLDFETGSSLLNMPEQIGYLHALGLDFGYGPTSCLQWLLEHVHVYSGLPWWGSIAALTVLLRVAIFRPSLKASEHSQKMQDLRKDPRFNDAFARMQSAGRRSGPQAQAEMMEARQTMSGMQRAAGVQMWRTFVPLINIPIGLGMFRLLRSMASLPVPGLEEGGMLWFQNLTVPDPYFILPIASAATMFLIMRQTLPYMAPQQASMMKMIQYVLTPLSLIITANMASGLQFFFFVSGLLQYLQSWLFYQPWLRKWANLGPPPRPDANAFNNIFASPAATNPSKPSTPQTPLSSAQTQYRAPTRAAGGDQQASTEARIDTNNPITNVKNTVGNLRQRLTNYADGQKKDTEYQKAQDFEKKRELEEKEKFYQRMEERRLRKLEKKSRQ